MVPKIPVSTYSILWIDPTHPHWIVLMFTQLHKLWKWCFYNLSLDVKQLFPSCSPFWILYPVEASCHVVRTLRQPYGEHHMVRNYGLPLTVITNLPATRANHFRSTSEWSLRYLQPQPPSWLLLHQKPPSQNHPARTLLNSWPTAHVT